MLRKYIPDPSHVLREQPVQLKESLNYEETPVQIVNHKEQVLRSKVISLVKVMWKNHERKAATWEPEAQMRHQYPQLSCDLGIFLSFKFSLFISATKCSKGGRICNAPSRQGVRYV